MYKKLINSAGQWLKVEKHPHYPKELSHPALSPSSLEEAFTVSLVVTKFMLFWSSIFHNSMWENGATHLQFFWVRESDSLIPLFADVIDKLCQGWEGGRSCVSCKVTRKCAACGAVNHSLTDQTLQLAPPNSIWRILGLSGTDSSLLLKKTLSLIAPMCWWSVSGAQGLSDPVCPCWQKERSQLRSDATHSVNLTAKLYPLSFGSMCDMVRIWEMSELALHHASRWTWVYTSKRPFLSHSYRQEI